MRLDELDSAIIRALLENAGRSLREVAAQVGSTPTTVGARLEKMEAAGLVQGRTLRLDPARVPGRVRLFEGRVAPDQVKAVLAAATSCSGIVHAACSHDGRLVAIAQVTDLDQEDAIVAALGAAGATGLGAIAASRAEGPGLASLFPGATGVDETCAECRREVTDDPVVETLEGRRVPFCCTSCQRLFMERHAAFKRKAQQ